MYRSHPALFSLDTSEAGFAWVDANDHHHSVLIFWRRSSTGSPPLLCVINFTPMDHKTFRIGVPDGGWYAELLNTDAVIYGGSGHGNLGGVQAEQIPHHGQPWSISVALPSLASLVFSAP